MAFHHLFRQLFTINGIVNCASDSDISGHIVADRITVSILFTGRHHREDNAPVFNAIAYPEFKIILLRGHRHRRGNAHQSQLSAARGGISIIFIQKDKNQPVKVILFTRIPGISFNDQLLTRLKADQSVRIAPIGSRANVFSS